MVSSFQTYRHSFHGMVADRTGGGNTVLENGQLKAAPPDLYHNKYSRLVILDKKSRFRADIFCPLRIKQVLTPVQRFCSAFLIADSESLCQDAQKYISGEGYV
ncbi:hypothetical protein NQ642_17625 [Acinetobacter baumannii]|nr:hypothetical protein [Acinetobacter baumannii]